MCGIVGWIDEQADLRTQDATLEQMVRCLIPRGPDEQGQWLSPHAALAHRRLIVLDPPGGRQPMCYQEGERTYVLTYNGEIYNFREIRAELGNWAIAFTPARTPRWCSMPTRPGASSACSVSTVSLLSGSGMCSSNRCCWHAITWGSSHCSTRNGAVRCSLPPNSRRCWRIRWWSRW